MIGKIGEPQRSNAVGGIDPLGQREMIEVKGALGILQHKANISQAGRGAYKRLGILEDFHSRPRAPSCDFLHARDCLAPPLSQAYLGGRITH